MPFADEKFRDDLEFLKPLIVKNRELVCYVDEKHFPELLKWDPNLFIGIKRFSEPIVRCMILEKRKIIPKLPKYLWQMIYLFEMANKFVESQSTIFTAPNKEEDKN